MSENELPNQNSGCSEQPMDYLNKAAEACAAGDLALGLNLYLAAYEKAANDPGTSTGIAVAALREAWQLACDLKERSMAEHVFERLEQYLSRDEIAECAQALQNLALDRLEEYGFSREDLQDMAEAFSQDFLDGDASLVKVEHITIPNAGMFGVPGGLAVDVEVGRTETAPAPAMASEALTAAPDAGEQSAHAPAEGETKPPLSVAPTFNPYDDYPPSSEGTSWRAATNVGSGWSESVGIDGSTVLDQRFEGFSPVIKHEDETSADEATSSSASAQSAQDGGSVAELESEQVAPVPTVEPQPASAPETAIEVASASITPPGVSASQAVEKASASGLPSMPKVSTVGENVFSYNSLVGYDEAVSIMRDYGFGLQKDAGFVNFVSMLNERHGLSRMPAADTMLFRAPAIEDATRFVEATIGELGLPALRMSIEEGMQGMPMLCITTDSNNRPRMNRQQNRFNGPAVLVLEDLDLWRMPEVPENIDGGMNAFVAANITRGAREAVNLIRSAVEDPDVFVLVTSSMSGDVEPFFYEVLEPLTIIDIGNPTESEREGIWTEIMQNHPSARDLDLKDLVRFSAGMARYDIYVAAREAVEEAYKAGLVQRGFVPVTAQNMFDKLASSQPFDSDEYRALEDKVVSDFVDGLDDLERLLGGQQDLFE